MIVAGRVVGMDRAIGVDECLEAGEVRVRVLLVVDLDADAELGRQRGCPLAEQRRVLRERLVPGVGVGDAADRHHHADPLALEVVDDRRGHPARHAVERPGIGRLVQQLQGVDEAQDHEVDRGFAIAAIDQPMVLRIELADIADRCPGAGVVAAMPGAEDLDRRRRRRQAAATAAAGVGFAATVTESTTSAAASARTRERTRRLPDIGSLHPASRAASPRARRAGRATLRAAQGRVKTRRR